MGGKKNKQKRKPHQKRKDYRSKKNSNDVDPQNEQQVQPPMNFPSNNKESRGQTSEIELKEIDKDVLINEVKSIATITTQFVDNEEKISRADAALLGEQENSSSHTISETEINDENKLSGISDEVITKITILDKYDDEDMFDDSYIDRIICVKNANLVSNEIVEASILTKSNDLIISDANNNSFMSDHNINIDPDVNEEDALSNYEENSEDFESMVSPIKESSIKHPLENMWTFWMIRPPMEGEEWGDGMKAIYTVEYAEDFWAVYNRLIPPSYLNFGYDYCFFKNGIKPMWEDKNNHEGGRWVMVYSDLRYDNDWKDILLLMIGDQFDPVGSEICGSFFNKRKGDKINVWLKNCRNKMDIMKVGEILKNALSYGGQLSFQKHNANKRNPSLYSL